MIPALAALSALQLEANAILHTANLVDYSRLVEIAEIFATLEPSQKVVVTGVGKSAIAARKIAATLSTCGIPGLFYDALGLYHGELGAVRPHDVVLLISHSGETEELLRLLSHLEQRQCVMMSIVGDPDSTLGRLPLALHTHVTHEVWENVPTASFASTCAIGHSLAVVAAQLKGEGIAVHHPGGEIGKVR